MAVISFKNDAQEIQLYREKDENWQSEFYELSMLILGRNATDNQELEDIANYRKGAGCYCVCCENWGLVLFIIILFALVYVLASFAIAYARDENIFG